MLPTILKIAFSSYLASSALLFAFPTLLHRKHTYSSSLFQNCLDSGKILRIAHRGGSRQKVQNTIPAFQYGCQYSEMLEMDICETKDKVLVVHHDKTLLRTCGLNEKITSVDHKNLPKIQSQVQLHFTEEIRTVKSNADNIPTLEEVFQKFPKMPINVQIKTPSTSAVKELQRLIQKYDRLDITFVGIAGNNLKILQENFPQSHRFISYAKLPKLMLLYVTGLLGFSNIPQKVLQIPLYTKEYEAMKKRELGDTWRIKLLFIGIKAMNVILVPFIWHLKKRGIMTYLWVCNSQQDFKKAIQLGCNGIMTDQSLLLSKYLTNL